MQSLARRLPAHSLLDTVIAEQGLKNDAALSRALKVEPPHISKIRSGKAPVTAETAVRLHEAFDMPIARIKELAGIPRFDAE